MNRRTTTLIALLTFGEVMAFASVYAADVPAFPGAVVVPMPPAGGDA